MVEQVRDAEFFHINRGPNRTRSNPLLNVGDVIEAGSESNPVFGFFETYHRAYPVTSERDGTISQYSAIRFLKGLGTGEFRFDADLSTAVQLGHETAKHFMLLAREMFWELTRIECYSDAPSRHRCMWLIDSDALLDDWQRWLECEEGNYRLTRLIATGNIHRADASLLLEDAELLTITRDKAHSYWRGEMSETGAQPEVLFEGTARVAEVLEHPPP